MDVKAEDNTALIKQAVEQFAKGEKGGKDAIDGINAASDLGFKLIEAGLATDVNAAMIEHLELKQAAGEIAKAMATVYRIHGIWTKIARQQGFGDALPASYAVVPLDGGR